MCGAQMFASCSLASQPGHNIKFAQIPASKQIVHFHTALVIAERDWEIAKPKSQKHKLMSRRAEGLLRI
jgi:hypothetical protein